MNEPWRLLEGSVIEGRYHLEKLLGAGGYGAVFRASEVVRDRVIRQLAVKLISLEDSDRQLHELETALNVQHPNLIRCFSGGETTLQNQQFFFLLMELAECSLEQRLQQGTLTSEETGQLLQNVAAGLAYLHDSKRVHRDLTPGNIFWAEGHWKIGDFGLTRQMNNLSRGMTNNPAGRPGFAAPEAYQGKYLTASDIWSLGIVTIYALTKQLPFNFHTDEELYRCVIDCKFSLPELPKSFSSIVQRCLSKEPINRYTAKQVLQAVTPSPSPPVTAPPLPTYRTQNYQETLPGNILLEMVAIPAGTFLMGSPYGEGDDKERPQHQVTVSAFYMSKYAVTNAQWKAVMGTDPALTCGQRFASANKPVVNVSWDDAQTFCQKLSQMIEKKYRLPSEAEWEYACRGDSTTPFYFGKSITPELANYKGTATYNGSPTGEYRRETTDVGSFPPNKWSLCDMHGNVWEWCEDDWHNSYKGAPNDGKAWAYDGPNSVDKVLRGGSWFNNPANCRSASRFNDNRTTHCPYFGFRVCCVP